MFLFLALASSKIFISSVEEKSFVSWMRSTNSYFSGDEYHFRLGVFLANQRYVQQFNRQSKSFKIGLNKFACLTPQEYQLIQGAKAPFDRKKQKVAPKLNSKNDSPDNFDWREKGVVNPIQDQSMCGACWSFSAIQAQESAHAIATGELIKLSESNLLDCCDNDCKGCSGGWPNKALSYAIEKQNGQFNLLHDYVYYPWQRTCQFDQYEKVSHISEVFMLAEGDENNMKEHIANVGPVSVCIDASQASFQLYTNGIYNEENCIKNHFSHAVGIVGYGVDDESGEAYWIVRNSWTITWGESGYIRIHMGSDTCNIADEVCYPVY